MKFRKQYLLVLLFLTNSPWAAEPVTTGDVQAQLQAEQEKKQSFANALWHYLSAVPARQRQLVETVDRLYNLALTETTGHSPDAASLGLHAWQEVFPPLRALGLTTTAVTRMDAVMQAMKESTDALSNIPAITADASAIRRVERQQALMAAASALGELQHRAVILNAQFAEEARRADAEARLLGAQTLMLQAPAKEKP